MRKVVHGYFTPKSTEAWRPFVQSAINDLLDEAEAKGRMDVMRDFATPLPVLVIAQMMGVPRQDRPCPTSRGKAPEHRAWGARPHAAIDRGHARHDRLCLAAGR